MQVREEDESLPRPREFLVRMPLVLPAANFVVPVKVRCLRLP